LTDTEMQQIARETNYSETSFILGGRATDGSYAARHFTPGGEVPFAGHPTLGTAWVIRHEIEDARAEQVQLRLPVGLVPVRFDAAEDGSELLWMRQTQPVFGPAVDAQAIAPVLRLHAQDVDDRFPAQEVSTGLPFWIVPLRSLAAVERCRIDLDRYEAFVRDRATKSIYVFCTETREPANRIHARMFSPAYGVPEDPATGSATGCLAAWLLRHRRLDASAIDVRIEQGIEMGRPSLLRARAAERAGQFDIEVGGRVVLVARGQLV
jgi:trans-2,3-dihydro-3-hydroxyanthranilate isomerase